MKARSSPSQSAAVRLDQEAAEWILRKDRGLTAVEQDAFSQWLAADPAHGAALAHHRQNWERLDRLAEWLPEHGPRPNRDLLAPAPVTRRRLWRRAAVSLALAASLAVGAFLSWPTRSQPGRVPGAVPVPLATIQERTLEDGSTIVLNRGAEVSILFTAGERRVQLEHGEAHFTVAKNPLRPFIVTAAGVDVRAVGTAFNVKRQTGQVEVLVTEGRVNVLTPASAPASGAKAPLVEAGQLAVVALADPLPHVTRLTTAQMAERLDWQPRLLDFTNATLGSIVAEFSRRNAVKIIIADPEMAALEVSASLRSDNVEGFVRLLEGGFGIRAERAGDTLILRKVR